MKWLCPTVIFNSSRRLLLEFGYGLQLREGEGVTLPLCTFSPFSLNLISYGFSSQTENLIDHSVPGYTIATLSKSQKIQSLSPLQLGNLNMLWNRASIWETFCFFLLSFSEPYSSHLFLKCLPATHPCFLPWSLTQGLFAFCPLASSLFSSHWYNKFCFSLMWFRHFLDIFEPSWVTAWGLLKLWTSCRIY